MKNINKSRIININKIIIISLFSLFIFSVNHNKIIKIDNEINQSLYKENLDFSQFETKHKVVAIYYPDNYTNKIENVKKYNKINYNSLIEYMALGLFIIGLIIEHMMIKFQTYFFI